MEQPPTMFGGAISNSTANSKPGMKLSLHSTLQKTVLVISLYTVNVNNNRCNYTHKMATLGSIKCPHFGLFSRSNSAS